jgi:beta-mannosidase
MNLEKIGLNGKWQMAYCREDREFRNCRELTKSGLRIIPAKVPGNFELDLQKSGLLPEPFYGLNMKKVNVLEDCHVYYFRHFNMIVHAEAEAFLIFEGLDTFAEVYLNGRPAASCRKYSYISVRQQPKR